MFNFFCFHEWKLIDKTTTESVAELIDRKGILLNRSIFQSELKRKIIYIFKCEKCKGIKKLIEKI